MSARRAALAAALACNPPATGEPGPAPPVATDPPPLTCEDPPPGTLALLPVADPDLTDRTCPWVLVAGADETLTARSLARADAAVVRTSVPVIPPSDCRPCRFSGVVTAAGPLVLAIRPSADSELPGAAWLGAGATTPALPPLVPGAGPPASADPPSLAFAPLWFGQPVFGDSTFQGPPWTLAPYLCPPAAVRPGTTPAAPSDSAAPPPASTAPPPASATPPPVSTAPPPASTVPPPASTAPPAASAAPPDPSSPVVSAPPITAEPPVLVLLPEPRLPGAHAEEPPPALTHAAGVYTAAAAELLRRPLPDRFDMSLCTRVALELP